MLSKTHIFLDVLETCNVLVPQYDYTSLDSSLSKRQKQAPQMICHSIADGARHGLELHLPRQMASARHGWFFEVCCFRMRKNESPRRSQSTLDVCQTKVCCFWMSQSLTFPQHGKKKKKTIYSESLWLMMGHGLAVCGPDFPSLIPSKRRVAGVWQVLQDFLF